jgi:hypothetical protein
MQLPTIDRTPNMRPAGADLVSSGANRVIPIAPVNPSVNVSPAAQPGQSAGPSAIDLVNPALKIGAAVQPATAPPTEGEPVYTSVPDPTRRVEAATAPHDWTIHRPAPEKVEDPPPKPLSQVLMDHLRTMWTASASAIQIEQVKNQVTPAEPLIPTQVPGDLAKEVLTYVPAKIKKTENI